MSCRRSGTAVIYEKGEAGIPCLAKVLWKVAEKWNFFGGVEGMEENYILILAILCIDD